MSGIYGILGLQDNNNAYVRVQGQDVVAEAIREYVVGINEEVESSLSIFVERTITGFAERYLLPGGGFMQKKGSRGRVAASKRAGKWDVNYPLEEYEIVEGGSRKALAYMRMQELDAHLDNVEIQSINTVRFDMLKALFNNVTVTGYIDEFADQTLNNIKPLANGDTDLYPPVIGATAEATEDHYLASGYAAGAISDVNNPYPVIRKELEHHFGQPQGFGNIIVFIHGDQVDLTEDLTGFVEVTDRQVIAGDDDATLMAPDLTNRPGRLIGRVSGVWVAQYDHIPTGYLLGTDLDAPAPLKKRVHPEETGLADGLTLVSQHEHHPLQEAFWEHDFGFACGNRLNGVVMELTAGAYSIPTIYA